MTQQGRKVHYHSMGDQHCLSHAPCAVNAVQWSEDNLIAVAAGHTVVIASPADITGPRAYAALDSNSSSVFLGCKPDKFEDSVPIGLACMMETGPFGHTQTTVRALSWSPSGCTQSGACLLALVSNEGKVQLFQPPAAPLQSRWELVADLTAQLQQHMEDTAWQDAELAAAADDTTVLRLRGGGSGGKPHRQTKKQQQQQEERAEQMAADTAPGTAAGTAAGKPVEATDAAAADAGPPAKRQKRSNPEPEQQGEQDTAQLTPATKPRGRTAAGSAKRGAKSAATAGGAGAGQGAETAAPPAAAATAATARKRGRAAKAAAETAENAATEATPAGKSADDSAVAAAAAAAQPAGKRSASSGKGKKAAAAADQAQEAAAAAPKDNQVERNGADAAATAAATPAAAVEEADTAADHAAAAAAAGGSGKSNSSRRTSSSRKKSAAVSVAGASKEPGNKKQSTAADGKKAAAAAAANEDGDDPHAHLPRTAAGAAAFAVGEECEVMNDEEGLRGAWWCGRIVQMQYGYALFEYDALFEDTEGTTKLKEWFPIPGPAPAADPAAAEANAGGYYFHTSTTNMIRPKPPQELLALSGKPAPRDAVEVFVDDGWWRTRILSVTAASVNVPIAHPLNIVSVPLEPSHVRHVTVWECDTGIWDHGVLLDPGAPPPATGAEPAAAAAAAAAAAKQQRKTSKEPASSRKKKAAAAAASPEQSTEAEDGLKPAAAAAVPGVSGKTVGRAARQHSSAAAKGSNWIDDVVSDIPGLSSSDDEDAPASRGAAKKGGKRSGGKKNGGKRRRGGSGSESDGSDWALSDEEDSEDHEITDEVEDDKTEEGTTPEEPTLSEEDDDELPRGRKQIASASKHIAAVRTVPSPMQAGALHPLHRGDGFRKHVGQLPQFSAAAAERLQQQQQGRQGLAAAAKAAAAAAAAAAAEEASQGDGAAAAAEVEGEADSDGPLAAAGKRSAAKAKKSKKKKEAEADDAESNEPHSETEDEEGDPEAEYKVPDGLDPTTFSSMLPARVTLSDADAWTKPGCMPRAIAARFSQLRADVPEKKLPHYKKGQHLRKNDLRLWTRVWAEFTHLHKADMEKHTTAKKLITMAKGNIRRAVLQTFEPKVRSTSTPYLSKGYIPLDGSKTVIEAGPSPSKKSTQSLSKAMVAAAKEAVPSPAPRLARSLSAPRTGGKRKRDASIGEGLGLIAAAAAAAAAEVEGGVIGPLASVTESQDAAAGCKSLTKLLSRQALGLEIQVAANPLRGPSLRVRASTATSSRLRGYAPTFAYNHCSLTALEGPTIDAAAWEARRTFMSATSVAWSPTSILDSSSSSGGEGNAQVQQQQHHEALAERVALLAIGTKAGCVQLWRYNMPQQYKGSSSSIDLAAAEEDQAAAAAAAELASGEQLEGMQYLGAVPVASGAYVTSLTWAVLPAAPPAAAASETPSVDAGTGSSSCTVLPSSVVRRGDGDVLLLAVGTSVGDVTLWSADPAAQVSSGTPCNALTALGTAILPDRQAAMVLDMAVVAAAAAAAVDDGADGSSEGGWQLLLAAGKTLGCISAWRSGVLCGNIDSSSSSITGSRAAAYSTEQLSLAITSGMCTSKRCHGVGFVTGVLWGTLDQQLVSSGADGQLLTWVWGKGGLQPGRACSRFNRQWLRPSVACAMTPAARKVAPMAGLAGSGSRLVLAVARDWKVTEAAGELDSTAGAAGVRLNASAWERLMHGALQLFSSYGPADDMTAVQQLLTQRLLPALMWQGAVQPVLPAAALWDMAVAVARCGWQSLSLKQGTAAAADEGDVMGGSPAAAAPAGDAAGTAASQGQQQGSRQKQRNATDQAAPGANMADLIPVRDARTEVVQKMAKKQLKEVQLQLELLSQLLRVLTEPFNAAVAASSTASEAADSAAADDKLLYRKMVPLPAWRGLQLACYLLRCFLRLWKGPQHEAVQKLPQAVQLLSQLEQLLCRWELELLQRHLYCSLSAGLDYCLDLRTAAALAAWQRTLVQQQQQQQLSLPQQLPDDAAAASTSGGLGFGALKFPLSEVLMADWVSLNIQSPDLNSELLRPAAVVYASYGLAAPLAVEGGGSVPARELNPLGPEDLPPVSVSGQGLTAMAQASIAAESAAAATGDADGDIEMAEAESAQAEQTPAAAVGAHISWPRCSTTLMLCPASSSISNSWGCSSCGRRYIVPPSRGLVTAAAGAQPHEAAVQACMPRCIVCGCRLSPGGAAAVGLPGAVAGVRHVLDGSPVLGVGMSLTDVLLPV